MSAAGIDAAVGAKVVVLGERGAGKTCLVLRFIEGTFSLDTSSTVGAFFLTKKMMIEGTRIKLQIWDTAGQERFRSMAPMYYRGASAAVLVFDITQSSSFEVLKDCQLFVNFDEKGVNELNANCSGELVLAIAENKCDLSARRVVSSEAVQEYAQSIGAVLVETSAKTNCGVDDLFLQLSKRVLEVCRGAEGRGETGERKQTPQNGGFPPRQPHRNPCCS